jgi:hypothetical protein
MMMIMMIMIMMMMVMMMMMTKVTIKQNGEICKRCITGSINGRRLGNGQMSVCLIAAISILMVLKEDRLSFISGFTTHNFFVIYWFALSCQADNKKSKANRIIRILRRNYLINHLVGEKIEGTR